MVVEQLGGRNGTLTVEVYSSRYHFENETYSMSCTIFKQDIKKFIAHPSSQFWGERSHSNNIAGEDIKVMIDYLNKKLRRYQTVTDVLKSRSKYKDKYLQEFSTGELLQYIQENITSIEGS